jgi:predicted GTPase
MEMTKLRLAILAVLFVAPFLFLIGAGSYHLWHSGWWYLTWWPMALSLTLAYGLLWYWTRRRSRTLLPHTGHDEPPDYWTKRDAEAWKLVDAKVHAIGTPTVEQLTDPKRYADEALSLALEIARIYQPAATDPFNHLTLPEILACSELVAEDLSRKVNQYVVGSHMLTIGQWRNLRQYADWGQQAWNLSWLARIALQPIKASTQFLASKAGGSVLTQVQNNVLAWFHSAYLHELGRYLIELNSGRLKVGAKRYRELLAAKETPALPMLTVAIVGAVKAGKSSLINALLGEDRAGVDVIPLTNQVTSYELKTGELPPLRLLDTPGYGATGPNDLELKSAFEAAKQADLLLFVTPARTAARKADVEFLAKLAATFQQSPELKPPPRIVALSHVDLLTPAAEWSPPYDWHNGTRPKEATIRDAATAAKEQLGESPMVPVCTLPARLWNVHDELPSTLSLFIDDARGAAILRLFKTEGGARPTGKTVDQVFNVGREALKAVWDSVKSR